MSLGNKLTALGQWIERRFPEKLVAADVRALIASAESSARSAGQRVLDVETWCLKMEARIRELEKKSETYNSDINKVKVMLLAQRPR